jgi:hypothetical protein
MDIMNAFNRMFDYIIDLYGEIRNQNKDNWDTYSFKRDFAIINEKQIIDWLNSNVGKYNIDWNVFHYKDQSDIMIKSKESSTMFALVWVTGDNRV